jgi:hypothetical protein
MIEDELRQSENLVGISSLADGADQIFADVVLQLGGSLLAVLPSADYARSFGTDKSRKHYEHLLSVATDRVQLPFSEPSEDAYLAAGKTVVDKSDKILAVWDGKPAAGRGGTADIVRYAELQGTPVVRIWPPGASRQ